MQYRSGGEGSVAPPTPEPHLTAALDAARAGDAQAFATVYRDTHPRLLRYAASLIGADADDVTSEAWLQIARDLRTVHGDIDGFRGWAARIVRNRAIDHARARNRRPSQPIEAHELAHVAGLEDTYSSAAESMSTRVALALVGTLPPEQAEAVLLRVVVGLDAQRAGEVLGKSAGAVRVASHRGLRTLAEKLDRSASSHE